MKNLTPEYWEEGKRDLREVDFKIREIIDNYEFPSLTTRDDIFFTLIRSIVGQQISVKAADTVWEKLLNKAVEIRPEIIFEMDKENMRSCCLLYTSPSPRDGLLSRMPSSA